MTFSLPTAAEVKAGAVALVGLIWLIYKKEVLDWLKDFLSLCKRLLLRLLRWLFRRPPASRIPDLELNAILDSGLGALDTYLCLLQKEYGADRVTVTEYEEQPDGGAYATCLVEVHNELIRSVRNLKQTPLPPPLWGQIKQIATHYPKRVRIVSDARVEESAVVKAALLNSGAWSAYYEMMPPDDEGKYEKYRLLALSWHSEYRFTPERLSALRSSAYGCYMALLMMEKVEKARKKAAEQP